jgi:hypothetical protein
LNHQDTQITKIQPPAQNELYATDDHYTLALIPRNELGFRVTGDAFDVYGFAEAVLLVGYQDE